MGKSAVPVLSTLRLAMLPALCLVHLVGFPVMAGEPGSTSLDATYGKLPLSFEANMGQADPAVAFLARGRGYNILLTRAEAVLALHRQKAGGAVRSASEFERTSVRVRLVGGDPATSLSGAQLLPGKANYFLGKDPNNWRTNIPTYARVEQPGVYPGIDLVYYGNQRELEYDFVVAPGADPNQLRLAYDGVDGIEVEAGGDLLLRTKLGEIRQHRPVVYQETDGVIRNVPATHVITGRNEIGFQVKDYDATRPLVIDPTLSYGTLLGGSTNDQLTSVVADSSGNAYVCGMTTSVDFPVTPGAFQGTKHATADAFVTKLNATGTALVYSTFLGGNGDDGANAIAVDNAGDAYVGGYTYSSDFPTTTGAFQPKDSNATHEHGFVTKLNPAGSALVYSTYLGGVSDDYLSGLAIDSSGNVYATGWTWSTDFPVTAGAFQTTKWAYTDAYVAKLNPSANGSASLVYSTLLGGSAYDAGWAIAVDSSGSAYVTGQTQSTDFPTTPGAYRSSTLGNADVFVVKVNPAGSALTYSALLGGIAYDAGRQVVVDAQGNAYVAGQTESEGSFPTTPGAYQTKQKGSDDVFVTKLNPAGSALVYSTFIGGSGADIPYGMALDSGGYVYLTGVTQSTNFPATAGALRSTLLGSEDAFVCQLNDTGSALLYSTYLGGSSADEGKGIALDTSANAYIVGTTISTDFPTTAGAYQTALKEPFGAFIVKIAGLGACTSPRSISMVSGNNQSGAVNATLSGPLVVEVDQCSSPVAGVSVTFSPTNATVNPSSVQTDASGRAQTTVKLGSTLGAATVSASAAGVTTPVVFSATATAPVAGQIVVTSAASYAIPPVAPGMIAVIWSQTGSPDFATATQHAPSLPLPTSMGGISVKLLDSGGTSRDVPLIDVTPRQLNIVIPDGTQGGNATITVNRSDGGTSTGTVMIESVAPGLFSATSDGKGRAVGQAIRVKADGSWTTTDLSVPIDMGLASDNTILVVYGTGIRGRTSLVNVSAKVGGQNTVVDFAGAQGTFAGLDQVNLELPRSLRGMGDVSISLTVDGKTANALNVTMAAVLPGPAISSISPTSGQTGQTISNFTINGTNLTGGQVVWDNPAGLTLSNLTVTATSVKGTLAIASNAAAGAHWLWITTSSGESNHLAFTVTVPTPSITSTPANKTASPGDSVTWTFQGTAMASVNRMTCTPGDGITINAVTATDTQVIVPFQVASTAPQTQRTCNLTNSSGWSSSNYTLNISTYRISNLRATATSGSPLTLHITVDYSDPTGAVSSGPLHYFASIMTNTGFWTVSGGDTTPTGRAPGATSGSMSFDFQFPNVSGTTGANVLLYLTAPDGRQSDSLSVNI